MEALLFHLSTGRLHLCIVQDSFLKEFVGEQDEPIQRTSNFMAASLSVVNTSSWHHRRWKCVWWNKFRNNRWAYMLASAGLHYGFVAVHYFHLLAFYSAPSSLVLVVLFGDGARVSYLYVSRSTFHPTLPSSTLSMTSPQSMGRPFLSFTILKAFDPVVHSGFLTCPTAAVWRTRRRRIHARLCRKAPSQRPKRSVTRRADFLFKGSTGDRRDSDTYTAEACTYWEWYFRWQLFESLVSAVSPNTVLYDTKHIGCQYQVESDPLEPRRHPRSGWWRITSTKRTNTNGPSGPAVEWQQERCRGASKDRAVRPSGHTSETEWSDRVVIQSLVVGPRWQVERPTPPGETPTGIKARVGGVFCSSPFIWYVALLVPGCGGEVASWTLVMALATG